MAQAKQGKAVSRIRPQLMSAVQTPGTDRAPKKAMTGKQKVGYAMRGAKKVLAERGYKKDRDGDRC